MANQLLRERNAPPVSIQWAYNFVKRQCNGCGAAGETMAIG